MQTDAALTELKARDSGAVQCQGRRELVLMLM